MNDLSSHFSTPLYLSTISLILILIFYKRTFKSKYWKFWTSISVFCLLYIFIVGSAAFADIEIMNNLKRFDLNHDGIYSVEESTAEFDLAMDRYINDIGRNLSPYIGFIFSSVLAIVTYLILWGFQKYQRLYVKN